MFYERIVKAWQNGWSMPVLGGPAVIGILPEELTGKDTRRTCSHRNPPRRTDRKRQRRQEAAAATKEETDLSGSPAENHRRMKTPKQVERDGTTLETNAALDERTSLSGRQAAAEVPFEGQTVPAAAAADNHC